VDDVPQTNEAMATAAQDPAPLHHGMSAGEYLGSRISSLKPPLLDAPNPIRLLRSLNSTQWAFFFVAFAAWVCLSSNDYIVSYYMPSRNRCADNNGYTDRHGMPSTSLPCP